MRKTITIEQLDLFEVDDDGRLYWKGAEVIMEHRLVVPKAVNYSVIGAGSATAVMAAFSVISYFWPACPHP